jgi:hypothetical protein
MTRAEVIRVLRDSPSLRDCSYDTPRHGRVAHYRGVSVVGDDLLVGCPAAGGPPHVRRQGNVRTRPLADVPTDHLGRLAWQAGLISYADSLSLLCSA